MRSPPTDDELVQAWRNGDPDAYGVLYRRHQRTAYAVASSVTRDGDLANDVVAEAFASVLAAAANGRGPRTDFRRYLCAAVRNHSYRMSARRRREVAVSEPGEPRQADEPAVALALHDPVLREAFRRLPSGWQRVLWLSAVDGWSASELAAELDVSPGTAAARTYRARNALRSTILEIEREALRRRPPVS